MSNLPYVAEVKNRIKALRDQVAEAEDRAEQLKIDLEKEKKKTEEAQMEANKLTRIAEAKEEELEEKKSQCEEASSRLKLMWDTAEECNRCTRVIETRALNDEVKIGKLEIELKRDEVFADEANGKYEEVARKLITAEEELKKAECRSECAKSKCRELSDELEPLKNSTKSLQAKVQKDYVKNNKDEEKIECLCVKLVEAEKRAELAERLQAELEATVDKLEDEIQRAKVLKEDLQAQLGQCEQELSSF